jgi:hypothetical protein
MKNLLRVLLLAIVIINDVACTRRPPKHLGAGRYGNRGINVTQPNPHNGNTNAPVNPVTPRNVDKAKPTVEQITQDLVGHSLSEGIQDGYYPSDWHWTIHEGEISNFTITRVVIDSSNEYEVNTNMRLTSCAGKAFDAKVRIRYLFTETEGWHVQFVQSMGMHLVKTHLYDDCVKVEKDGWWYYLKNHCELALEVGGKELHYNGWEKFSHVVEPHGSYNMYNPDEIIIDYIERP